MAFAGATACRLAGPSTRTKPIVLADNNAIGEDAGLSSPLGP